MERKLSRKESQQLLAQMLERFAEYCEKNNLRYYLVGGTLLGAVSHQGFITWDDDIDVGMPRADYERFLRLVKKRPVHPDYELLSASDGTLTLPFAELVHKKTRLERPSTSYIEEKYQVLQLALDIFPQDGWPSTTKQTKRLVRKASLYRAMNKLARARLGAGKTRAKAMLKLPAALLMKGIGCQRINAAMDRLAKRLDFDKSAYVGAVTYGIYGCGERCRREEVLAWKELPFEGRLYRAPGCLDSYLTAIYGDYMKLPPKEKQCSHGVTVWYVE